MVVKFSWFAFFSIKGAVEPEVFASWIIFYDAACTERTFFFSLLPQFIEPIHIHYTILHSQAGQSVLHKIAENFNAYQEGVSAFFRGENAIKPKLPKYRKKGGFHEITYPEQALKKKYDENGYPLLGFPLGWDIKKLYGPDMHDIDYIWMPYPANINPADIVEVTISPQNGDLYAVFVYKISRGIQPSLNYELALGIDHGVNNWLTCVPNTGKKGFIIDGKQHS